MRFDQLGLKETVLTAITESGYENPTPIQAQAIPLILEWQRPHRSFPDRNGQDRRLRPPLSFQNRSLGKPQILVLEPTRELAHQVAEQFEHYGKHTGCKVALLYGGVGHGKQDEDLKAGADIVVATPGRLIDHFFRGTMRFGALKVLILDEVDRMLDMGFLPQVRKIINLCPWNNEEQSRQTLFFSATMPPVIKGFAEWCLTDPESVEIARAEIASTISHSFFPVAMPQRDELLLALLSKTDYNSVMIFTRTRKEADVVSHLIIEQVGDIVAVMHSDIKQNDRMKALKGFKEGRYKILVATDVAARGIDISDVTHVINYRVPENAEDYVHRIGRTGRAEKEGDAFTILTADELEFADSVEAFVEKKIERKKLEGFEYQYTAMLDTEKRKPIRKPRRGGGRKRR